MDTIELLKYFGAFVAGLASGYTLSIKINKQKFSSSPITMQNNNRVSGGQAGRDINNNQKK